MCVHLFECVCVFGADIQRWWGEGQRKEGENRVMNIVDLYMTRYVFCGCSLRCAHTCTHTHPSDVHRQCLPFALAA